MALAPAAKLLVPPTVAAPVWVIAPPAVIEAVPLALNAPSAIAALSNCRVRLRRLVRPLTAEAPALTLRSAKSRVLAVGPPTLTAPGQFFALLARRMSQGGAVDGPGGVAP